MFHALRQPRSTAWPAATLILLLTSLAAGGARADSRLNVHYAIKAAGISIGQSEYDATIGAAQYTSTAKGQASAMLRVLVSGEGNVTTQGTVVDGKLMPTSSASSITRDKEKSVVKMTIENGEAKDITAETSLSTEERVPVTAEHKKGIVDPLTALLIHVDGTGDLAAAPACQRTLPVFDGRRRFDLVLSFKRIEQVKTEKGYAGPVVVCAVAFKPIAGHRPSSSLLKYLTDGRDIEMVFAPIAGTRLLGPYRLSIASMLGNLVIEATDFETSTTAAADAPAATTATK